MKILSNNNYETKANSKRVNILFIQLKHIFVTVSLIVFFSLSCNTVQSQVRMSFNVALQPLWGPVGYNYANYYYLPEADVFYSVPENKFYYLNSNSNRWIGVYNLPPQYNVDLYNTYKVVVKKQRPYLNHGYYVSNYAKYKHGGPKQLIIRESDEPRYVKIKGHPKFGKSKDGKNASKNKDGKKKGHSN